MIGDYLGRIERFAQCELSELKERRSGDEKRMIEAESEKIIAAIGRDDFVVLMDEKGRQFTSPQLADFISQRQQAGTKRLAFVIGGFAGASDALKQRADAMIALSMMTFTHELARVILTEQIYRAYTLLAGLPYHKA